MSMRFTGRFARAQLFLNVPLWGGVETWADEMFREWRTRCGEIINKSNLRSIWFSFYRSFDVQVDLWGLKQKWILCLWFIMRFAVPIGNVVVVAVTAMDHLLKLLRWQVTDLRDINPPTPRGANLEMPEFNEFYFRNEKHVTILSSSSSGHLSLRSVDDSWDVYLVGGLLIYHLSLTHIPRPTMSLKLCFHTPTSSGYLRRRPTCQAGGGDRRRWRIRSSSWKFCNAQITQWRRFPGN